MFSVILTIVIAVETQRYDTLEAKIAWVYPLLPKIARILTLTHHEKAAEHHEQASKHHKEAVKHHESGDEKTAAHHAHIAHGHSAQATEQETEASKKYAEKHNPKK